MIIIPFLIFAGLSAILYYARNGGMGKLGQKIRNSDHWTLEDAILEKQQELDELIELRSKYKLNNEN